MIRNKTGAPSPNSTATLPRRCLISGRKAAAIRCGVGVRIAPRIPVLLDPYDRGRGQPLRIVHDQERGVWRDRGVIELCADSRVIAGLLAIGTGGGTAGRQVVGGSEVSA